MVAAMTPTTTGHLATDPTPINTPEATPAAGQNTATPSDFSNKAKLNRAARK